MNSDEYIQQAESSARASVKQYFFAKAYQVLFHTSLPVLEQVDKLISDSGCFSKQETCLSPKYATMLDFEDLGQMLDGNMFFQVDGLVLNLDFWTIENISGTSPSVTAIQFMKQAALEAHSRLYQMGMDEFISLYNHLFDFYVFDKIFEKALGLHFEGHTYEASCIFFPYFEHTLGDLICCNIGCEGVESGVKWGNSPDPCPLRITDILEDSNLVSMLGKDLAIEGALISHKVFVLKLLIGPMTGFNLRNLTWHGFINPSEIPPCFLSLIFAIFVTLPNVVVQKWKQNKYHHTHIGLPSKSRGWFNSSGVEQSALCNPFMSYNISNPNKLPYYEAVVSQLKVHYRTRCNLFKVLNKFECHFPPFNLEGFTENNWSDLKKSIKTSGFPLVGQMHQWERCIEYCRRKEYFMFLMISIPMLEHSLRRAFACENNSTDRLISADPTSLMTIMDIILSYKLEQGAKNHLIPMLGDKVTSLLWDLFVWSDGSLLRDFLAHGAIAPREIPTVYVHQVFLLIAYLMAQLNCDGNITNNPIVQACSNYMQDFIPNFNPKNMLLYAMKNSYQKLVSFTRLAEQAKKFEWPKPSLPETDQQPAGLNDLIVDGGHDISSIHTSPTGSGSDGPRSSIPSTTETTHSAASATTLLDTIGVDSKEIGAPSRCQIRTSFYLHALLERLTINNNDIKNESTSTNASNTINNSPHTIPKVAEILFTATSMLVPAPSEKLAEFLPRFTLWCPKGVQQLIENLISTCALSDVFVATVTEEHNKLYDLVITRKAWKTQREMFARLMTVIQVYPIIVHLIMVIVECSFHQADLLQKSITSSPTDDIPQLVPKAVFVRKLNDCIGMMTTAVKAHWWPHAEELFECFVGRKFDRSFALVEGTLYTLSPEDPSSPVIDFQNINKRDKKNLENTLQDYIIEISHAAPTPPSLSPPSPPAFECEVCGSSFLNHKLLRKHVKELDHRKWKQERQNN